MGSFGLNFWLGSRKVRFGEFLSMFQSCCPAQPDLMWDWGCQGLSLLPGTDTGRPSHA